jgi:hypothetical protein
MGPAIQATPTESDQPTTTPPPRARPARQTKTAPAPPPRDTPTAAGQQIAAPAIPGPVAGEPKVQVNPRIYQSTWRHYEDLVEQLPRPQRRGALTALVNAILAQHAPRSLAEARTAIAWLRQAEIRDTNTVPADDPLT